MGTTKIIGMRANDPRLDWDPEARELYTFVPTASGSIGGAPAVRAGTAYAIVRPGYKREPLGIVSDRYKLTSHRQGNIATLAAGADMLRSNGVVVDGHGYHVAYGYHLTHMVPIAVRGLDLRSKLIVAYDHTGTGALQAAVSLYYGESPLGAIVRSRGLHVSAQPTIWAANIGAMIEASVFAQDFVGDLLLAAHERVLDDAARKTLISAGVYTDAKDVSLLDAIRTHCQGRNQAHTWGVWSRRLGCLALREVAKILEITWDPTLDRTAYASAATA